MEIYPRGVPFEMCLMDTRHQRIRGITGESLMEKKKKKPRETLQEWLLLHQKPLMLIPFYYVVLCGDLCAKVYI